MSTDNKLDREMGFMQDKLAEFRSEENTTKEGRQGCYYCGGTGETWYEDEDGKDALEDCDYCGGLGHTS